MVQVLWVKRRNVDTGCRTAGEEQIRFVVIVNEYIYVKGAGCRRAVECDRPRSAFFIDPWAEQFVGAKNIRSLVERSVVAGKIKGAVVLKDMRCNREASAVDLSRLVFPVDEVARNSGAAACSEQIIGVALAHNRDVSEADALR